MEEPTKSGSRPLPSSRAVEYIARGVRLLARSIIDMWDIRSETQRLVSAILPPSSLSPPGPQSAQETVFTFPILFQAGARTASSRDSAGGVPPLKRSILQVDPTQQTEGHDTPILGKWGRVTLSSFYRTQGRDLFFRAMLKCYSRWMDCEHEESQRRLSLRTPGGRSSQSCFCSLSDTYCWEKDTSREQWRLDILLQMDKPALIREDYCI